MWLCSQWREKADIDCFVQPSEHNQAFLRSLVGRAEKTGGQWLELYHGSAPIHVSL